MYCADMSIDRGQRAESVFTAKIPGETFFAAISRIAGSHEFEFHD
jgi:hypothetical protein